jgi:hypothetical protein
MSPCARFEGEDDDGGGGGPVALVDAEGNFSENYLESIDEDIRGDECFKLAGNFKELTKQFAHAQRMVGKDKIALPGENASDEDWAEFYNKTGRPATEADYAYTKPEGIPDEHRSDERMTVLRTLAHDLGMTQKQFGKYMARDDARILAEVKAAEETAEREVGEAEKELKDLWGMAYEERIQIVNRFINETTEEGEERDDFIKKYGRDPLFVKWAAKTGKKLVESDVLIAELTQKAPKEAQVEFAELQATDQYKKYMRGELDAAAHANMQRKVTDLFNIMNPPEKAG